MMHAGEREYGQGRPGGDIEVERRRGIGCSKEDRCLGAGGGEEWKRPDVEGEGLAYGVKLLDRTRTLRRHVNDT